MRRSVHAKKNEALLARLRAAPDDASSLLAEALASTAPRVVAAAAALVGARALEAVGRTLPDIWARFAEDPVEVDPGCVAKLALVDALVQLERNPSDILSVAVAYRQVERTWDGKFIDSAAALRAHAALGLARQDHPDAANAVAELLADPEWLARAGAARAAIVLPSIHIVPALRFKCRLGDEEPTVLGECFIALLALDAAGSLHFVARFLDDASDEVAEHAALALGESRREDALARLVAQEARTRGKRRERVLLTAIGVVRSDASRTYLLSVLAEAAPIDAFWAAEALAIYRHDQRAREMVAEAARRRGDPAFLNRVEALLAKE